jgi:MraZ protein
MLVSAVLRQLAGLEKEAMLVGQGSHFELWSMEGWRAQMEQALAPGNALPATLENFSL